MDQSASEAGTRGVAVSDELFAPVGDDIELCYQTIGNPDDEPLLLIMGLGGPMGDGRQYLPWVHIDDVVGAALFALDRETLRGAVNVTAPQPLRWRDFAAALGRALHRPAVIPVPGFALRLALGEGAAAVLSGQNAVPRALLDAGYTFRFDDVDAALRDVLGKG